jgi:hypothetical protein
MPTEAEIMSSLELSAIPLQALVVRGCRDAADPDPSPARSGDALNTGERRC